MLADVLSQAEERTGNLAIVNWHNLGLYTKWKKKLTSSLKIFFEIQHIPYFTESGSREVFILLMYTATVMFDYYFRDSTVLHWEGWGGGRGIGFQSAPP